MKKLSIILPSYNSQNTLKRSLDSISNQTLSDIEIIVVDDCSTDKTSEIVKNYKIKHENIVYIRNSTNMGVHESRLVGLKASSSEWVGFLDADDIARPDMYEIMYKSALNDNSEIIICGVDLYDKKLRNLGSYFRAKNNRTENNNILEKFCRGEFGSGSLCNKIYKRDIVFENMVNLRWRQDASEDTILNIGYFLNAKCVTVIDKQLYCYTVNEDSASHKVDGSVSFARTLRAYAVAIDTYKGNGQSVLRLITELYARELRYNAYYIDYDVMGEQYKKSLIEAVDLAYNVYPIGIAMLMNHGWPVKCWYHGEFVSSLIMAIESFSKKHPALSRTLKSIKKLK